MRSVEGAIRHKERVTVHYSTVTMDVVKRIRSPRGEHGDNDVGHKTRVYD